MALYFVLKSFRILNKARCDSKERIQMALDEMQVSSRTDDFLVASTTKQRHSLTVNISDILHNISL